MIKSLLIAESMAKKIRFWHRRRGKKTQKKEMALTPKVIRSRECAKKAVVYKEELRRKRTPSEAHVYNLLQSYRRKHRVKFEYNPRFKFQKAFWKGSAFVIVDFYFPKTKTCLEIDGGYHYTESGIAKDKWRDNYLKSRDKRVFHVKNEVALSWNLDSITKFLHDNEILYRKETPEPCGAPVQAVPVN